MRLVCRRKDPTQILVCQAPELPLSLPGDESESDLDLEYSGAIAPGATIYFVYVGSSANFSVFDALTYAIDARTAPVITISYGSCESDLGLRRIFLDERSASCKRLRKGKRLSVPTATTVPPTVMATKVSPLRHKKRSPWISHRAASM